MLTTLQPDKFMDIIFKPSPNIIQGRKGYRPIAIVIHIMQGSLAAVDDWFTGTQSKVSAHYGVGKDGRVHRYVLEANTAWHAGRVNMPTWKLLKKGGNNYIVNPNFYTLGIEHEGYEHDDWTDEMYDSSSALIADMSLRWGIPLDRDHVIGHHEIFSLKTCPGDKVDLDKLIAMAIAKQKIIPAVPGYAITAQNGTVKAVCPLHIRTTPDRMMDPIGRVEDGTALNYSGFITEGESVSGCSKWYVNSSGNWFWAGGVI
jgi:N-acetylmuramoyl-L-alanine amidase